MTMNEREMLRELEAFEMEAWQDFYGAASQDPTVDCPSDSLAIDGAIATRVANVDVLALNRVLGLGQQHPATEEQIERFIHFYSEVEAPRFFVQLGPGAQPADLDRRLAAKGFQHYNNWVKLYRDTSPPPPVSTDLTVRRIDTSEAEVFGEIVAECFNWPDVTLGWIASLVARPRWHHYIAYDDHRPTATGAMFVNDDCAWLDFAATRPEYRGRGAQASLLARRITDAADLGCRRLIVETAEDTPQKNAPSFRNVLRFDFRIAYTRPNFIHSLAS